MEETKKRGDHVINNNVLKIYKRMLDMYVNKVYGITFDHLRPYIDDEVLVQSYDNPIDSVPIRKSIQEEMVVNLSPGYIDENQAEYGSKAQSLVEKVVTYMQYCKGRINRPDHSYDDSYVQLRNEINRLIIAINAKETYVDGEALKLWLKSGGSKKKFDTAKKVVAYMFESLDYGGRNIANRWAISLDLANQRRA